MGALLLQRLQCCLQLAVVSVLPLAALLSQQTPHAEQQMAIASHSYVFPQSLDLCGNDVHRGVAANQPTGYSKLAASHYKTSAPDWL